MKHGVRSPGSGTVGEGELSDTGKASCPETLTLQRGRSPAWLSRYSATQYFLGQLRPRFLQKLFTKFIERIYPHLFQQPSYCRTLLLCSYRHGYNNCSSRPPTPRTVQTCAAPPHWPRRIPERRGARLLLSRLELLSPYPFCNTLPISHTTDRLLR